MPSEKVINQIIGAVVSLSEERLKYDRDGERSIKGNPENPDAIDSSRDRTISHTTVSEEMAAFIIRSVVMNPVHKFDAEKEMSSPEIERLIKVYSYLIPD
jgi:hypothetical protein